MSNPQYVGRQSVRGAHVMVALLVLLGGQVMLAPRSAAQTPFGPTQFTWPDTTVDVARYTTVDQCLAATQRTANAIAKRGWQPVWTDTMPWDPHRRLAPLPAPVEAAAQRCSARFDAHTASLADFAPLSRLYLEAGRDTDVTTLLARRLRAAGTTARAAREAVVDTVFQADLKAQPVRLAAAAALLRRSPPASRVARLEEHMVLAAGYATAGDTTQMIQAGATVLAIADSLTPAERASPAFQTMGGVGWDRVLLYVIYSAALTTGHARDSLRESTAAYVRYMHGLWPKRLGRPPDELMRIGQQAPRIIAEYWLPGTAAAAPRPTPGRVALVTFLNHGDCGQGSQTDMGAGPARCFELAAQLHRLAARFPTLQISTVAYTRGYFAYVPPPTAAQEAAMIEREFAAFHFPGALAISATHFQRLPPPDGRRLDAPDPNVTAYGFGARRSAALNPSGKFYLIDPNGVVIIDASGGNGPRIANLTSLLDVLIHRQSAAAATTSR